MIKRREKRLETGAGPGTAGGFAPTRTPKFPVCLPMTDPARQPSRRIPTKPRFDVASGKKDDPAIRPQPFRKWDRSAKQGAMGGPKPSARSRRAIELSDGRRGRRQGVLDTAQARC